MNIIPIDLLYWGHAREVEAEQIYMHRHDFCQLEFLLSGQRRCLAGKKEDIIFNAGEAVFIPMNKQHAFQAMKKHPCSYFSFKFQLPEYIEQPEQITKINSDFFTAFVCKNLEYIADLSDTNQKYNISMTKSMLISVLAGLLEYAFSKDRNSGKHEILQFMNNKIYQFGASINVEMIADGLNLTVPQLRYRFRKCMKTLPPGEKRYDKPADFIAEKIFNKAKEHLQNTNLSISEISQMMKFNDIYSFSHFFKRNSGMSPLQYRKQLPEKTQDSKTAQPT